jgi:hypothetical protein
VLISERGLYGSAVDAPPDRALELRIPRFDYEHGFDSAPTSALMLDQGFVAPASVGGCPGKVEITTGKC